MAKKSKKSKSSKIMIRNKNDFFKFQHESGKSSSKKGTNNNKSKPYRYKESSKNSNKKNKDNDIMYCIPSETVKTLELRDIEYGNKNGKDKGKNKNVKIDIDNPYLIFNRYIPKNIIEKSNNKKSHLELLCNEYNPKNLKYLKEILSNLKERHNNEIKSLRSRGYTIEPFDMKNDYIIVVGLGGEHVLETNITLHQIYGIPYIPGSALKGLAKAAAIEKLREYIDNNGLTDKIIESNKEKLKKLFKNNNEKIKNIRDIENYILITKLISHVLESDYKLELNCNDNSIISKIKNDIEIYKKIFGTQNSKGRAIFFDAFPDNNINFKLDVMTPHFQDYYRKMESNNLGNYEEMKSDKLKEYYPTDYQSPNPIIFLVLSKQKFKFTVGIKLYDEDYSNGAPVVDSNTLLNKTTDLLKYGLKELGVGAKTSVGYGYFE